MQCDLRSAQTLIESMLGAQSLGQVGGLTETVAFFCEQVIFNRQTALTQRLDHAFGLARHHHGVQRALEENLAP